MHVLWDYVSIAVVAFYVYPLVRFAETADVAYIFMLVGLFLTDYATKLVKDYTQYDDTDALKRPADARDCDFFCRNGECGGLPGFPSGHMAITAFFFTYLYLATQLGAFSWTYAIVAGACVLLVAAARCQKDCHTLLQVVVGSAWGAGAAVLWRKAGSMLFYTQRNSCVRQLSSH